MGTTQWRQRIYTISSGRLRGYIVGELLRDYMLKRPISDVDITTNARPFLYIAKLFKTVPTGLKYGR